MKLLFIISLILPLFAFAKIEDNSFLLEEAFNQEWGVFQFIQKYRTFKHTNGHEYTFENEIPITDKTHQFSYALGSSRPDGINSSSMTDMILNYRWQPVNRDGFLLAERFGLIVPTGSVEKGTGNGVYGLEFMQAATMTLSERWMNHWNMGFKVLPNAEETGINKKRTLTNFSAGSSLIYLLSDSFNLMLEGLLDSGQTINADGSKTTETSFFINPGMRFDLDLDWDDTQIVPGISFPMELLNSANEQSILVYLSIEPKFY